MINTIQEFINEFLKIKEQEWLKTHRSGPTGVGKTLEDLLGIVENNKGEPDFGEYELKSTRINSKSMLTIFTKSPEPKGSNSVLLNKFGYVVNGKKKLHITLDTQKFVDLPNKSNGLKINCFNNKIFIETKNGIIKEIFWEKNILERIIKKKYLYDNQLVYAKAKSRNLGKNEEFWYTEAYLVKGVNFQGIYSLIKKGILKIDIRIGTYPDGRTHDHGTGFRIMEKDQDKLFENMEKIV